MMLRMPTRWRLKWYHFLLAAAIIVILSGLHVSTNDDSREYVKQLAQHWGWKRPQQPDATSTSDEEASSAVNEHGVARPSGAELGFDFDKQFFQGDIDYRLPTFDTASLKHHTPHNYRGPGHETFATYYATRDATNQDPYFLAALQVVYRTLWDPRSKSKYPMTVFVAPFISQEQRDVFSAAGALVRELALVPFEPNEKTTDVHRLAGRLLDVMSKLLMWNQTDFSRIAFLDSDAFPFVNPDALLSEDMSPEQKCNWDLVADEDKAAHPDICDYVFGGWPENPEIINAGVMVLKPNEGICEMLLRDSKHQENFDNGFIEQAFLSYFFRPDGPFPPSHYSSAWNGGPDRIRDGKEYIIIHGKIWALVWEPDRFISEEFNATWQIMLNLYESDYFRQVRLEDNASPS